MFSFSGIIVGTQGSVLACRVSWVGIWIYSTKILATCLDNFGILFEIDGFIDLFRIGEICLASSRCEILLWLLEECV